MFHTRHINKPFADENRINDAAVTKDSYSLNISLTLLRYFQGITFERNYMAEQKPLSPLEQLEQAVRASVLLKRPNATEEEIQAAFITTKEQAAEFANNHYDADYSYDMAYSRFASDLKKETAELKAQASKPAAKEEPAPAAEKPAAAMEKPAVEKPKNAYPNSKSMISVLNAAQQLGDPEYPGNISLKGALRFVSEISDEDLAKLKPAMREKLIDAANKQIEFLEPRTNYEEVANLSDEYKRFAARLEGTAPAKAQAKEGKDVSAKAAPAPDIAVTTQEAPKPVVADTKSAPENSDFAAVIQAVQDMFTSAMEGKGTYTSGKKESSRQNSR